MGVDVKHKLPFGSLLGVFFERWQELCWIFIKREKGNKQNYIIQWWPKNHHYHGTQAGHPTDYNSRKGKDH